jgi:pimeloyl-ACP methyl ester carboxylesterase
MPFDLAVFDPNAAKNFEDLYPAVESWYLGGHSLGGAMASSFLSKNANNYKGLLLLGAYSASDLSNTPLRVLSVYGSEDGVLDRQKYEECRKNLPQNTAELVLEGGCHAGFGMYGSQKGDGTPGISQKEQIARTADALFDFLNQNVKEK